MVPQRLFLQAVALAASQRADGSAAAVQWMHDAVVSWPAPLEVLTRTLLVDRLPPTTCALLLTTDPCLKDYRALFEAAGMLGVLDLIVVTGDGPAVQLPRPLDQWRSSPSMRLFLEVSLLCRLSIPQIIEDVKRTFGTQVDESDVVRFEAIFVDKVYVGGDHWFAYEKTIGHAEAVYKRRMMGEPTDYVRWRLGVPVPPDSERVLDRLISDAYYTERTLKAEAGDMGVRMTKDDLARIKMERDTIFKGLAAKARLKEAASAQGGSEEARAIQKAMAELILEGDGERMPTLADLGIEEIAAVLPQ